MLGKIKVKIIASLISGIVIFTGIGPRESKAAIEEPIKNFIKEMYQGYSDDGSAYIPQSMTDAGEIIWEDIEKRLPKGDIQYYYYRMDNVSDGVYKYNVYGSSAKYINTVVNALND